MPITHLLISWYHESCRPLPWRMTTNPYLIWISEVILQQTRVDQGNPYYQRFAERFPTVTALASASEADVLLQWQGLGYYSRARNLHKAARTIVDKYDCQLPGSSAELIKLSGIGPYTASAVASIAFKEPSPAIDGNVMRVIARYYSADSKVNSPELKKLCTIAIRAMMQNHHPGDVNQALMELGALICRPAAPMCTVCPIQQGCSSFSTGSQSKFPVPAQKAKPRNRYFVYLVLTGIEREAPYIVLRKRAKGDIWQGLHDFPLIETKETPTDSAITDSLLWKSLLSAVRPSLLHATFLKHQLTHQTLHCWFIRQSTENLSTGLNEQEYLKIPFDRLHHFPFPRLIQRYFELRRTMDNDDAPI
ncbi:MAG TPA: A/G-specific adenine glycosylase [Bacteroidales bacterium]|nr:MAG: A/G-specific adenine glycosylase [Bacteroidetes bacterium GWE2_42_24]OFY27798.1 MAG: A/G-specific adenine glycosylase [Bacteroidetes bacterium GWF2_43_11]HBZ66159.1 A/G-specific adenine glycosylase [Bacteroidales bacterium]